MPLSFCFSADLKQAPKQLYHNLLSPPTIALWSWFNTQDEHMGPFIGFVVVCCSPVNHMQPLLFAVSQVSCWYKCVGNAWLIASHFVIAWFFQNSNFSQGCEVSMEGPLSVESDHTFQQPVQFSYTVFQSTAGFKKNVTNCITERLCPFGISIIWWNSNCLGAMQWQRRWLQWGIIIWPC